MMRSTAQEVLDMLLQSPSLHRSDFVDRVFTDEPILMRGSQMASYVPPRIQEMHEMALSPEGRGMIGAQLFTKQALFMEDYEDDVEYHGSFERYFPTYVDMNDRQLRGYFSWRSAIRRGEETPNAPLSFAFVHLYELIASIGIELEPIGRSREGLTRAEQGFLAIEHFWKTHEDTYPELQRYVTRWLRDYAVWHGLDTSYLAPYVNTAFDEALVSLTESLGSWMAATPQKKPRKQDARAMVLAGADRPEEERLFAALDPLSTYRPRVSRLYRDRPETLRHVTCSVIAELALYYEKHRKSGLVEDLFGSSQAFPYAMFMNAVFWTGSPHEDTIYEISPCNRYGCAKGRWYHEGFQTTATRSSKLGAILRLIDQRLRVAIGYPHPLTKKDAPKYLDKIVAEQIESRLAWEADREARAVRVDLSQLAGIRAAANATCDSLLIDEEREDEAVSDAVVMASAAAKTFSAVVPTSRVKTLEAAAPEVPAGAAVPETEKPTARTGEFADDDPTTGRPSAERAITPAGAPSAETAPAPYGLTAIELELLRSLLDGTPWEIPAGTSLDMLVDSINEKLFDLLGDTALEFDGLVSGMPVIIDDYTEDVREALSYE